MKAQASRRAFVTGGRGDPAEAVQAAALAERAGLLGQRH
jgi:hypothetical protein